jgi:polysaccharide chain length determinant protein (PEP-CTERM system associated)
MLWTRRWLVLSVWLIASVASVAVVSRIPSVYQAEAVIVVDSQKIPETFVSSTVNGDPVDRLAMITESIMSSARLLDTIRAFNLYHRERQRLTEEELLREMHADISVSFEKNWTGGRMQAFRLAYRGHDAKVVAAVTNRLSGLYVEENVRARERQAEGTVDFLARQLQQAKASLDEQEQKLAQFKQTHNGSLPEQQGSLLATLSSLSVQLEGTQSAIARSQENKISLEAELSAVQSSEASLTASLQRQARLGGVQGGYSSTQNVAALEQQLGRLRMRYQPEHPDVQALERALADAKREEAEEVSKEKSAADSAAISISPELLQMRERIKILRSQISVANDETELLQKERQKLAAQMSECQARIKIIPLVEQEMTALNRNYEESANNYKSLLQKQLAAGIATDMERSQQSERFRIVDAARVPEAPIRPNRPLFDGVGSLIALVAALLLAFGLETQKQTFLGEWELPVGITVLGRVPVIITTSSGSTNS